MKHRFMYSLIGICLAFAVVNSAWAQTDVANKRIGTSAASELLIPVGARDMAMGGATISGTSGVDALHWNPAGLGRMEASAEGLFSSMAYIADIRVNYGAIGLAFGNFGKVGFSIKALDFGEIPLTTVDDPENFTGRTFSPTFITLGVTYARQFTDAITAGATLKLVSEDMHRVSGNGFAVDVGVQYHGVAGFRGLNLGVALKNIGPQISFDGPGLLRLAQAEEGQRPTQYYQSKAASWELPSSVEIGLGYVRKVNDEMDVTILSSYQNANLALDEYHVGGEVAYKVGSTLAVAARGGYVTTDKGADDAQIFGPTVGFGFTYKSTGVNITVDYAYRTVDFFSNNNMFSVKLAF